MFLAVLLLLNKTWCVRHLYLNQRHWIIFLFMSPSLNWWSSWITLLLPLFLLKCIAWHRIFDWILSLIINFSRVVVILFTKINLSCFPVYSGFTHTFLKLVLWDRERLYDNIDILQLLAHWTFIAFGKLIEYVFAFFLVSCTFLPETCYCVRRGSVYLVLSADGVVELQIMLLLTLQRTR